MPARYGPSSSPVLLENIGTGASNLRQNRALRQRIHQQATRALGQVIPVSPSANLRAAIESAPGGVCIRLGEGTFVINDGITVSKGISIVGTGRRTILTLAAPLTFTGAASQAELRDLSLQMTTAGQYCVDWGAPDGIIRGVGCFNDTTVHGIYVEPTAARCIFSDLYFAPTGALGLGTSDLYFENASTPHTLVGLNSTERRTNALRYQGATSNIQYAAVVGTVLVA